MQNELLKVIDIATLSIHETLGKRSNVNNKVQDASLNDDSISNPLLDLLNVIFDRFRQIITVHLSAINTFKLIVKKHNLEVPLYDIIDVWSCMQAVVRIIVKYSTFRKSGNSYCKKNLVLQNLYFRIFP